MEVNERNIKFFLEGLDIYVIVCICDDYIDQYSRRCK